SNCCGVEARIAERYWVPLSLPCLMPCVGSCHSKNVASSFSTGSTCGSNTTRTASVCPVAPEQTSSYVGLGVQPPAYPTAVVHTPSSSQSTRSAPQKQPKTSVMVSSPSGYGGVMGFPVTMLDGATGIGVDRPGSAESASTTSVAVRIAESLIASCSQPMAPG